MTFRAEEYFTPFGRMRAEFRSDGTLVRLRFLDPVPAGAGPFPEQAQDSDLAMQLQGYFSGELKNFDQPLDPEGTEFQRRVWQELRRIPWGETISYAQLACRIGDPKAVRAVARANAQNPIAILIPCHRVIGSDGGLTGYAGGLWRKEGLLALEGARPGAVAPQMCLAF